jgi:branched-chain amino acid transport system permease protein
MRLAWILSVAVLVCLIWLGKHLNGHWMSFAIGTLVLVYLAYAWNIVGGFVGQMSLAHAAFWAIGSYSYVMLVDREQFPVAIGLVGASLISALYAFLISFVSYRFDVRGHYFALMTFAFTEIPAKLVNSVKPLGAAAGIYLSSPSQTQVTYYYIILVMVCIAVIFTFAIAHSRLGIIWLSLRDDEQAARAVGIGPFRHRTLALVISAVFTAFGGAFHAEYLHVVRPDISFDFHPLILVIVAVFLGGRGTVAGPLLGILFLRSLEVLSSALPIDGSRLNSLVIIFESALGILLVVWFSRGGHSGSLRDFLAMSFPRKTDRKIAS